MNRRPYIGVSGIVTPDEAASVVRMYERLAAQAFGAKESTHDLMLGILVSEKTLRGVANKWHLRYPKVSIIQSVVDNAWIALDKRLDTLSLPVQRNSTDARHARHQHGFVVNRETVPTDKLLNLIHYASDTPPTIDVIEQLYDLGLLSAGGFQFNGSWPTAETLESYTSLLLKRRRNAMSQRVVLQVGPRMMPKFAELVAVLDPYANGIVATDVLLDGSGGRGQAIDIEEVQLAAETIQFAYGDRFQIGFAGGLCDVALDASVESLMSKHAFSIDAEGRLRDTAEGGGNLLIDRVEAYLRRALQICATHQPADEVAKQTT